MKIKWFAIIVAILVLFESCISLKKRLIKAGGQDEAIKNAILDFSNTCRLYKKDSVFSISFYDTVHRMVLERDDNGNYSWIKGKTYKGIIAITILRSYDKFFVTVDPQIGIIGKLPSRFIEKDGKLFYWWDDNYPITEETVEVFRKHKLLCVDEEDKIRYLEFTDYSNKGVDYYFCRNNLTKYKRVITNRAIGSYDLPNLDCH
jgi:hypothetical protein